MKERDARSAAAAAQKEWSWFRRLLHEPLVHFLVAGFFLFAGYRTLHPDQARSDTGNRIELTADDLRQLEVTWMAQWRRPPTPDEMNGLIETRIREDILYREAVALGLDKGDTIVKRRLAQKMEFLVDDVSAFRDPSVDELRAWYARNSQTFAQPARLSFRHIYFSMDGGAERARLDATRTFERLAQMRAGAPVAAGIGDQFMFQNYYDDRLPEQIASVFGTQFAESLFQLKPGSWQGPLESGLGWHVVFITTVAPGRIPAFDEIEPEIKSAWIAEQRVESRRRAFAAIKARYEISLPDVQTKVAAATDAAKTGR